MIEIMNDAHDETEAPPGARLVGHISFEKATDQGEIDMEDALTFYRFAEERRKAEESNP